MSQLASSPGKQWTLAKGPREHPTKWKWGKLPNRYSTVRALCSSLKRMAKVIVLLAPAGLNWA